MLSMIFATTMDHMTILSLTLGAANGIYLTMDTALAVDTLPDDYEDGPSGGNAQLLGSKSSFRLSVSILWSRPSLTP
jgi:hypothetical protein